MAQSGPDRVPRRLGIAWVRRDERESVRRRSDHGVKRQRRGAADQAVDRPDTGSVRAVNCP